jgi:hypothetical protein
MHELIEIGGRRCRVRRRDRYLRPGHARTAGSSDGDRQHNNEAD